MSAESPPPKTEFARLPQSVEESETLLSSSDPEDFDETPRQRSRRRWSRCSIVACAIAGFVVAFVGGTWVGARWRPLFNPAAFCIRYTSQYSPVLKDVDISYNIVRFNGSLMKENVYRQGAGPAVDAAWEALGVDYRSLIVPADQAARSGLLPDQVKVSEKYGGGYPANVEGLHHLHCLNLLRQSLYYNYDYYRALGKGAFINDDRILRFHVSHCLDILRQQLMCTTDIGVLGQVWWNTKTPTAYVDFNTRHVCRNFEDVRAWAEKHQAPEVVPLDFLQPPGVGERVYETLP